MIERSSKKRPAEYGMKDYYKFYKTNYPYKVSKAMYNNVISDLNKFVGEEIVEHAKEFIMPHRTGFLNIVKYKRGVKLLADNTVVNTNPPNWKATLDLWKEDQEAKDKKILIRHTNSHTGGYVYSIKYSKYNATFQNKSNMDFAATRDLNRSIKTRINDYSKEKYNAHELKI